MCPQLVGDGFAHQPQGFLGQPAVRGLGLVEFEGLPDQIAQPLQKFALQRLFGRSQCFGGVAAEGLGNRGLISFGDQFTQYPGVFVFARQHIEQCGPQFRVGTQPVENIAAEQLGVQQSGGGAVQAVFAVRLVTEAVWGGQGAVPGMPHCAVPVLDM